MHNMGNKQNQDLSESLKDWADEALASGTSPDKVIAELSGKVGVDEAVDIVKAIRQESDAEIVNDPRNQNEKL